MLKFLQRLLIALEGIREELAIMNTNGIVVYGGETSEEN